MRLSGTTPAAPDDTGDCDPRLAEALSAGSAEQVAVTMLTVRLLVPVVAIASDADAEMAVPTLVAADGRRALPVFSSYAALRAWRADARPVPMSGARVVAGAAAEGYDGVVLDVAGPESYVIDDADLDAMAQAAAALIADPHVQIAPVSVPSAQ